MANFGSRNDESQGYYTGDTWSGGGAQSDFSYPFAGPHQTQQFGSFDYNNPQASQTSSFYNPSNTSAPQYFVPQATPMDANTGESGFDNFEDEPPLLEELGINPYHIMEKTLAVLNPLRTTDALILQDTDIVGPVVFCVMFGFILLFSGKVHFGYIYGIGVMGCIAMYFLLNMMSVSAVSLGVTVTVLGYCLLPMVGLAGFNLLFSLQGLVGTVLTVIAVLWCSLSASKLFVTALGLQKQQPLVAYPCALVYGVFALLAVF
ncbi:unnamed protein product [Allacma fusca]|uniref:Protein YIPF n=1 Tax=Allacma fusca TaxID=39272 RepID=A0A8J2LFX5_9HEXA|nr:unnamed protein product [Allacma fusca]